MTAVTRRRPRWRGMALLVAAAALAVSAYLAWQLGWLPLRDRVVLLVLPFESTDGSEFLGDGVTEEAISQLGTLDPKQIDVMGVTTSMQSRGSASRPIEAGKALGADFVLAGRVSRDERRIRLAAQFVDVRRQSYLWSETYSRDLSDAFTLQRDVAGRVAQSLSGGVLSPVFSRATRRSPSAAAYEPALRGRALRRTGTEQALRQSVAMFEEAAAFDGEYAAAPAGLADCYWLLGRPGWEANPPGELLPLALAAADRALDLDPELPEGYLVRGLVRASFNWDLVSAERDVARAIALNPSYARAHESRSALLAALGRYDEAVDSARRALDLDPLSAVASATLGAQLHAAGHHADAELQLRKTLLAHPGSAAAHWALGRLYLEMGRTEGAVNELREAAARAPDPRAARAWLVHALASGADRDRAEHIRQELNARSAERYVSPFLFAVMASGFRERDATLEWLEKARAARSGWIPLLTAAPEFAWLRDDARFAAVVADVKR